MNYWVSICTLLLLPIQVFSVDKLASTYLVSFGDPEAEIRIVQYFSLTCPHCLTLFKKDFQTIKEKYVDTGEIFWIFHPVPLDLLTVQAMDCLEKLSEKEKRLFLSALLEVMTLDDTPYAVTYMQKAMEIFGHPVLDLKEKEYLSHSKAFQDAFLFLKQKEKIEVVPAVEINGTFFPKEVPNQAFIEKNISSLSKQPSD